MDVEVTMPRLGEEMTEGTLVEWFKREGEAVREGEALFLVETGKAAIEVEAEVTGTLKKILVPENSENIAIGAVIAIIAT
jgi:pyruvate/2-oxoglutarate dehydrogenase complex dihydrolipoamide acyltransferase (E2) component